MLVCDLKAVAEVDHDLFNLFKCHEESFSKWQFLFFSLNWEVQHVAKKRNCEATSGREGRRPHSTQCSFKICCYQTSQCFFLGSVISVTVSLCNLPLSVLGDSVCGFCVFRCSLDTQVHRSHSVGVFHHLASAGALPAQTQQEADLLLLASSCKWCVTALDIVRESEKKCDCLLHVQALDLFFLFSFFRMYWIQSLQAFTSSPWAWWLWLLTLTQACWLEGWDVFKCIYSMLSNIKPSCIGIDSLLEHYSKFKQAFTPEWLVFLFLKERQVLKVWLCKKRKNTPNMSSLHTHEHTHVECNGCMQQFPNIVNPLNIWQ